MIAEHITVRGIKNISLPSAKDRNRDTATIRKKNLPVKRNSTWLTENECLLDARRIQMQTETNDVRIVKDISRQTRIKFTPTEARTLGFTTPVDLSGEHVSTSHLLRTFEQSNNGSAVGESAQQLLAIGVE